MLRDHGRRNTEPQCRPEAPNRIKVFVGGILFVSLVKVQSFLIVHRCNKLTYRGLYNFKRSLKHAKYVKSGGLDEDCRSLLVVMLGCASAFSVFYGFYWTMGKVINSLVYK